jgi:hypothetical protein
MTTQPRLVVVDRHGIYLPQVFAECCRDEFSGITDAEWGALLEGPESYDYWDTWEEVIGKARPEDEDLEDWYLYQDGDLWLLPPDFDPEKDWA